MGGHKKSHGDSHGSGGHGHGGCLGMVKWLLAFALVAFAVFFLLAIIQVALDPKERHNLPPREVPSTIYSGPNEAMPEATSTADDQLHSTACDPAPEVWIDCWVKGELDDRGFRHPPGMSGFFYEFSEEVGPNKVVRLWRINTKHQSMDDPKWIPYDYCGEAPGTINWLRFTTTDGQWHKVRVRLTKTMPDCVKTLLYGASPVATPTPDPIPSASPTPTIDQPLTDDSS